MLCKAIRWSNQIFSKCRGFLDLSDSVAYELSAFSPLVGNFWDY